MAKFIKLHGTDSKSKGADAAGGYVNIDHISAFAGDGTETLLVLQGAPKPIPFRETPKQILALINAA